MGSSPSKSAAAKAAANLASSSAASEARSSTASHYSAGFGKVSAGIAENEFYGVKLSNDILSLSSSWIELMILGIFVILLLAVPSKILSKKEKAKSSSIRSCLFWITIVLSIIYIPTLYKLVFIPILSTAIYTRTSYPYCIVIPHCIAAAASYRTSIEQSKQNLSFSYLYSFGISFFCYGFGGSIISDMLMGLPITAIGHDRIIPCHILGWLLIWYSPYDIIYQYCFRQKSFGYYFILACEAIDAITTPMGRISRSARELRNKSLAPIVAGLLAGIGGGTFRYIVNQIVFNSTTTADTNNKNNNEIKQKQLVKQYQSLEGAVWKTIGYSLLWWWLAVHNCILGVYDNNVENDEGNFTNTIHYHCETFNGSDGMRVAFILFHVLFTLINDIWFSNTLLHPFHILFQYVQRFVLKPIQSIFKLGPIVTTTTGVVVIKEENEIMEMKKTK